MLFSIKKIAYLFFEQSPNVGSDRSWVFNAQDYSDGELKAGQYAIRFKDNKVYFNNYLT